MLCVIKEIYTVYTSFICICGFYSLKIVVHLNIYVSNPQVSTAFEEDIAWSSFPTLIVPLQKCKTLIPHPSSKPFQWWKLAVTVEGLRTKKKQKTVFPQTNIYTEMLFPSLESSLPVPGKSYVVKTSREQRTLPENAGTETSGSEKVGSEVRIFKLLPETPRGCIQLLHVTNQWWIPERFSKWVVNPWGASNYEWSVISPI